MAFLYITPALLVILLDDRYGAKTRTGRNKSCMRHISAKEGQFDRTFPWRKRGKQASILCCLVHFCGVLWLWQEGWEEAERAFAACVWRVCDLLIPLPAPLYPSEQRAPTVMHTQRYCTPSTDTWDTSDVGYSIYRRHWFDRMHLIIWVFLTLGWVHMWRWELVQEFRADFSGRQHVKRCF